ncbi:MAG: ABC transporter substrate-binding protein, partial [Hymenobacter sp.]
MARTTVKYAKGFTIQYLPGYKVVTIFGSAGRAGVGTRYALVPRGRAHPAGFAAGQVIETPLRSLVALSSLHVALVDFLGSDDVVV